MISPDRFVVKSGVILLGGANYIEDEIIFYQYPEGIKYSGTILEFRERFEGLALEY